MSADYSGQTEIILVLVSMRRRMQPFNAFFMTTKEAGGEIFLPYRLKSVVGEVLDELNP